MAETTKSQTIDPLEIVMDAGTAASVRAPLPRLTFNAAARVGITARHSNGDRPPASSFVTRLRTGQCFEVSYTQCGFTLQIVGSNVTACYS